MRIGSLFSGAGGLDMAVQEVFGGEVIWQSEIDKAASKVLAHRFPDVRNIGDITEVDWSGLEPVDVLCGGFPCQDVSAAGKRAGIKDGTRSGLWAIFADAIDALRPRYIVIENVRGLLSAQAHRAVESGDAVVGDGSDRPVLRALGAVLGDLADLGYDAQWTTVAASSVGAPHRRERVFILATDTTGQRDRAEVWDQAGGPEAVRSTGGLGGPSNCFDASSGRLADLRREYFSAVQDGDYFVAEQIQDEIDRGEWSEADREGRQTVLAGGRGSGDESLELLPTPCVVDRLASGEMTLEEWDKSRRSQKERGVGSFGPRGDSLGAAILRVEEGSERPDYSTTKACRGDAVDLLPTPAAGNFNDGEDVDGWLQRRAEVKERLGNGNGMGIPLAIAVQLLPTPNASDGERGGQHPAKRYNADGLKHAQKLLDYVLLEPDRWGKYGAAIHRWEKIAGPAPAPTEPNRNGNPRLNPAFSEWMMGWPAGWVTDPDIGISRNEQLKIVGNGVCPAQAVTAIRYLLSVAVAE